VKRLALLVLLAALTCAFFASSTPGSDGVRKPGSWPKPAERCTTLNRGTLKWVRDVQNKVWIKWACRCSIGKITVCRWQLLIVSKYLYLRKQLPDGTWYIPVGWHKHLHLVVLPMASGGYCGYLWPTYHYVPARLR
jgi:hypothetical protein